MPYIPEGMPYIPSSPPPSSDTLQTQPVPHETEIAIDLLTQRRSSLELSRINHSEFPPTTLTSPGRVASPNARKINSTAVVKYTDYKLPAPLARLEAETNLNLAPDNWLRGGHGVFMPHSQLHSGFSSFKMANTFLDCLKDVDVISDGENIKRLLKIPYSKASVSMVVHRIGKTLLIDDFDIHRYLLRSSESDWEWIRKFATESLKQLEKKEGAIVRKKQSITALQERNLVSKFLYRSIEESLVEEPLDKEKLTNSEPEKPVHSPVASPVQNRSKLDNIPILPEPDPRENIPDPKSSQGEKFARNLLWTFEDIRMLIGSNMPIFGDSDHPCVSLKLRDMKKPINILTGMDYWLDNLMCQVPEVVMCYHLDGIVQKYELMKTEDLPTIEGSKFSPKVVRDIAQNILSFLKSNATKEGHTYWLFKGKDDEIVKLYDLTSLSQKDAGIKAKGSKTSDPPTSPPSEPVKEPTAQNPFQTPVSMLLYRVARNLLDSEERKDAEGTVKELLHNCLQLLDKAKFPQIATSAHFLLAELYLPDDTDPSKPTFHCQVGQSKEWPAGPEQRQEEFSDRDNHEDSSSVDVQMLCVPTSELQSADIRPPPISASVGTRCSSALKHIAQGLESLSQLVDKQNAREAVARKAQERQERDNLRMSVPSQPIPMPYSPDPPKTVVTRSRSFSESALQHALGSLSRCSYLKLLLLKKALLVYITMAEATFNIKKFGQSLKSIKRALNCYSMVESIGGRDTVSPAAGVLAFALGVAGDSYMALVAGWGDMPLYQEQFNVEEEGAEGIAEEVERHTTVYDRDWSIKLPKDIEEAMGLAANCYTRAVDLIPIEGETEEKTSLKKRLANVENELGVFYMNQAAALVQKVTNGEEDVLLSTALKASSELFEKSLGYLSKGVARFQCVGDTSNTALLLSNSGRLCRLSGHCAGLVGGPQRAEYSGEEASQYKAAIDYYHRALQALGTRKVNPDVWDSVTWELSSTLFTIGTLLQDHAPLSTYSREQVEKQVTDHMLKALKYCDTDSPGCRQVVYQYRAASIHHRLASLYHHAHRCYTTDDPSPRRKNLRQLSELHYVKAGTLFQLLDHPTEYLRTQLERAGLVEGQVLQGATNASKFKGLVSVLEVLLEMSPVIEKLSKKPEREMKSAQSITPPEDEDGEEIIKMLETFLQRLQFNLLSMVKLQSEKSGKTTKKRDKSTPNAKLKEIYAASLKCNVKSKKFPNSIFSILQQISLEIQNLK